jgi:hypothetical protein
MLHSSPWFWSRTDLFAPTTITKAGERDYPDRIVEIASVVNAIIEAPFAENPRGILTAAAN